VAGQDHKGSADDDAFSSHLVLHRRSRRPRVWGSAHLGNSRLQPKFSLRHRTELVMLPNTVERVLPIPPRKSTGAFVARRMNESGILRRSQPASTGACRSWTRSGTSNASRASGSCPHSHNGHEGVRRSAESSHRMLSCTLEDDASRGTGRDGLCAVRLSHARIEVQGAVYGLATKAPRKHVLIWKWLPQEPSPR
jgi:hypothetical protein